MTERQKDWQVVQAMKHYGGSFVKTLSSLWFLADEDNQRRIKEAWPEYWAEYDMMAQSLVETEGSDWWDR